jgi:hypothetical protein
MMRLPWLHDRSHRGLEGQDVASEVESERMTTRGRQQVALLAQHLSGGRENMSGIYAIRRLLTPFRTLATESPNFLPPSFPHIPLPSLSSPPSRTPSPAEAPLHLDVASVRLRTEGPTEYTHYRSARHGKLVKEPTTRAKRSSTAVFGTSHPMDLWVGFEQDVGLAWHPGFLVIEKAVLRSSPDHCQRAAPNLT